jgi:hypothetical protein
MLVKSSTTEQYPHPGVSSLPFKNLSALDIINLMASIIRGNDFSSYAATPMNKRNSQAIRKTHLFVFKLLL